MKLKTKVAAKDGKHDLVITRDFDLSVDLLFKAYTDADILSQWMGIKVIKLDTSKHGGYQFETRSTEGKVVFSAHGVIH